MKEIRVMIVEDNNLFANCISRVMKKYEPIKVVGHVSSGLEYLNQAGKLLPDIALLGVKMDKTEVKETIKLSQKLFPQIKLIAFTFMREKQYYKDLMKLGVQEIIYKDASLAEMVKSIKKVIE